MRLLERLGIQEVNSGAGWGEWIDNPCGGELVSVNPSDGSAIATVRMAGTQVRGIVADESGKGIAGALVSVVGYQNEAVKTTEGGNFTLPAHAADGQQVLLHAEKEGHEAANQWHPAGDFPATITLKRR
jgi:hypothetical protein